MLMVKYYFFSTEINNIEEGQDNLKCLYIRVYLKN